MFFQILHVVQSRSIKTVANTKQEQEKTFENVIHFVHFVHIAETIFKSFTFENISILPIVPQDLKTEEQKKKKVSRM